ncbi:unnamed protein product [Litomosoides sigmodontis]|uniref:Somatostatin/Cortistatin C-terminal domain-containing protein n=1 Tax=Litomosoides sigmodontis TaxID=42156 RepID=A0A3P6VAG4_LITSI|nr:unnamed protein product [Litomosoides sigmodontis]
MIGIHRRFFPKQSSMATFILTILLFLTFDFTHQCLPKPDIIENKSPFNMQSAKSVASLENALKKLLNITEAIDDGSDGFSDRTYNTSDTVHAFQTNLSQMRDDDKRMDKLLGKCQISDECNALWKRLFMKCRCQ